MILSKISWYKNDRQNNKPAYCIIIFLPIFIVMLLLSVILKYYNSIAFHFALFFTGWITWTFFEYIMHRFFMHTTKQSPLLDFNHMHHHSHPANIKISGIQRCMLFIGCIILLSISAWMNNYFTLAAGFLCGFPLYTLMHFFLHQKIAQKILSKLVRYHIYHHCKYPGKCFGISVTWWDDLFQTVPLNPGIIPNRIIDFYFNHETGKTGNHLTNTQKS